MLSQSICCGMLIESFLASFESQISSRSVSDWHINNFRLRVEAGFHRGTLFCCRKTNEKKKSQIHEHRFFDLADENRLFRMNRIF